MNLNIKTTTKEEDVASFVATEVLSKLKLGKSVLLFLTGGSSISVGVKIADILKKEEKNLLANLSITLTDERYGPTGHPDSNFFQLTQKGFSLPGVKIIPILIGDDRNTTVEKFVKNLNEEFTQKEYKIGLFGVGPDGHTAGILPNGEATHAEDLAFGYDTATFSRITMTFKTIEKLDEAVVWMQGENKWPIIENLKTEIDIIKQPAQILKKVPLLTIFSDYKNNI